MFSKPFLYRFRFPCKHTSVEVGQLDPSYRLPNIQHLDGPAVQSRLQYDFRIGWHASGLRFSLLVTEKTHSLWYRANLPDECDGIQICLDTRDIKDVHRASRFCHRLHFMPIGRGKDQTLPSAAWLPIHRAKEHPNPIDLTHLKMQSNVSANGYQLHVFIPGKVLTGYDPAEHPQIGFHFSVIDREYGSTFFLAAPPLPHDQDPSLWGTLFMVNDRSSAL